MKNILITGITGFLGTSLVDYFQGIDEYKIFGHSRDIQKAKLKFKDFKIEYVSEVNRNNINKHQIEYIIHLAGIAHDLSGKFHSEDYTKINYDGTKLLYDKFLESNARTFVFVSSIKAAIDHSDMIVDEEVIPNPGSAYGRSKLQAEEYINQHSAIEKGTYILRPCMVHGPGNKGNLNLLFKFVQRGLPYPLGAFHNQRSFFSVENFCYVIHQILNNQLSSGTYHLADDQQLSTTELVNLIGDVIGKKSRILKLPKFVVHLLASFGSIFRLPFNQSNISKLTEDLVVSNRKLLLNLGCDLPVSTEEGLTKTIQSFDE